MLAYWHVQHGELDAARVSLSAPAGLADLAVLRTGGGAAPRGAPARARGPAPGPEATLDAKLALSQAARDMAKLGGTPDGIRWWMGHATAREE